MKRLLRLIRLPTTRDVAINTIGNYLVVVFTAIYALVLVRILTPAQYGVLSVLFGIAYVLANILDFGVTASIYSYLPPLLKDKKESLKFIKANFIFQTVLSFIVLVIAFVFVKEIDKYVLKLHVPTSYFFWTFASIPLFIWQNFVLNILYAAKKFLYANIINNIANSFKVVLLYLLILTHQVSVVNVIIIFGVVSQLVFFIILVGEKKTLLKELINTAIDRQQIRLEYTLTFFAATQLFNFASRIDLFMLSFFLVKSEVGYYGLSQKIILTVLTMVNSITQVLSPQFANAEGRAAVKSLVKKGFVYMLIPTAMFLGAIILPTQIYTLIFTSKFEKTAAITRSLSIPYIFYSIIAIPTLFFLYTIKKPMHLLYINLLFLVIVSVGCFILIPKLGVFGPPWAFVVAFVVITAYIAIFFAHEYKKLV